MLGEIPVKHGAKAEGLAVLSEDEHECTILVLCDGPEGGDPRTFVATKVWN
jgi:hypothetical protein